MRVFVDDDAGYAAWLADHPSGWVINTTRRPTRRYLKLHHASCSAITSHQPGYSRWTTGEYCKVCGESRSALDAWARDVVGGELHDGCHCVRSGTASSERARAPRPGPRRVSLDGVSGVRDYDKGFRGLDSAAVISYSTTDADLLASREDLRMLLGSMVAEPGELLHGVIQGPAAAGTDLDNALLYNVGGRAAAATRHGILLERRPAVGRAAAGYRYRLTTECGLGSYREGRTIVRFADVPLAPPIRSWQDIWLALKTTARLSIESRSVTDQFTLWLGVRGPASVGAATGEFVKKFVDGVLTALHVHANPSTAAAVAHRMSVRLSLSAAEIEDLLLRDDRAVLGAVGDLVVARADGVQCWPQDSRVAALRVDIDRSHSAWALDGRVSAVLPA